MHHPPSLFYLIKRLGLVGDKMISKEVDYWSRVDVGFEEIL